MAKKIRRSHKYTPLGNHKVGYYYPATCPRCGKVEAAFLGHYKGKLQFADATCNNPEGVKPLEGKEAV